MTSVANNVGYSCDGRRGRRDRSLPLFEVYDRFKLNQTKSFKRYVAEETLSTHFSSRTRTCTRRAVATRAQIEGGALAHTHARTHTHRSIPWLRVSAPLADRAPPGPGATHERSLARQGRFLLVARARHSALVASGPAPRHAPAGALHPHALHISRTVAGGTLLHCSLLALDTPRAELIALPWRLSNAARHLLPRGRAGRRFGRNGRGRAFRAFRAFGRGHREDGRAGTCGRCAGSGGTGARAAECTRPGRAGERRASREDEEKARERERRVKSAARRGLIARCEARVVRRPPKKAWHLPTL